MADAASPGDAEPGEQQDRRPAREMLACPGRWDARGGAELGSLALSGAGAAAGTGQHF